MIFQSGVCQRHWETLKNYPLCQKFGKKEEKPCSTYLKGLNPFFGWFRVPDPSLERTYASKKKIVKKRAMQFCIYVLYYYRLQWMDDFPNCQTAIWKSKRNTYRDHFHWSNTTKAGVKPKYIISSNVSWRRCIFRLAFLESILV